MLKNESNGCMSIEYEMGRERKKEEENRREEMTREWGKESRKEEKSL